MSLSKAIDVRCDNCGTMLDDPDWTGKQARESARDNGWRTNLPGGRALFPDSRPDR